MPRVTLIGYRGSGKSTVAALLAARLAVSWQDADAVLEDRAGCRIAELIRGRGEASFRDLEADVLAELLEHEPGVVATGGGVVLRPDNRALLRRAGRPVVWLDAPPEVVRARLAADPLTATRRPALSGADPLDEVAAALADREPLYRESADLRVDAGSEPPAELADRILRWLDASGSRGDA
ncbi:MAG: shikimate kinase [Planctomycetota bacterium]|nr:shikimate kinase [Planctomycetota bacterium]